MCNVAGNVARPSEVGGATVPAPPAVRRPAIPFTNPAVAAHSRAAPAGRLPKGRLPMSETLPDRKPPVDAV